jgi:hypothetical protein
MIDIYVILKLQLCRSHSFEEQAFAYCKYGSVYVSATEYNDYRQINDKN